MADDYAVLEKLQQNTMTERTSNLILSNCIFIVCVIYSLEFILDVLEVIILYFPQED